MWLWRSMLTVYAAQEHLYLTHLSFHMLTACSSYFPINFPSSFKSERQIFFLIQLLLLLTTNLTAKFHLFAWIAIVLTLLCTGQQALALYQVRQHCEVGLCSSYLLLGDTAAELHGRREQWILLVRDSERVQGRGVQALWEQTGSEVENVSEAVDYRYIIDYPFTSWRWILVVSVALAGEAAKMLTYSLFSNFPSVVSGFQCHL